MNGLRVKLTTKGKAEKGRLSTRLAFSDDRLLLKIMCSEPNRKWGLRALGNEAGIRGDFLKRMLSRLNRQGFIEVIS